jgi:hypothetical protein
MRFTIILICLFMVSCSANRLVETSLYFGQSKPDGGMVTEKEWSDFKVNYIAKVFSHGSTVLNATGSWLDTASHKLITEPTYVVVHTYKKSRYMSNEIDSLRYWYKALFQQQSVLRIDRKVKASF